MRGKALQAADQEANHVGDTELVAAGRQPDHGRAVLPELRAIDASGAHRAAMRGPVGPAHLSLRRMRRVADRSGRRRSGGLTQADQARSSRLNSVAVRVAGSDAGSTIADLGRFRPVEPE